MTVKDLFGKNKETVALALIFIGTFFSGSLAIFADKLSHDGEYFSTFDVSFAKFFVAAAVFGIVMLFANRSGFKIKLKDLWLFIVVALMNVILTVTLFYAMNILNMPVALSTAIQEINPYFTIIFAYFIFKEKITVRKVTAICVAFLGCLVITFSNMRSDDPNTEVTALGLLLVVISAITVSLFFLGSKRLGEKGYSSGTTFFYVFLFSAILMMVSIPFDKGLSFENMGRCIAKDNMLILYIIGIGVVATLIPKFLFIKGVQMADAGKASVVLMFDLVTSAVYAQIFLHEEVTPVAYLGMLMILFSVAIIEMKIGTKLFRDGDEEIGNKGEGP